MINPKILKRGVGERGARVEAVVLFTGDNCDKSKNFKKRCRGERGEGGGGGGWTKFFKRLFW